MASCSEKTASTARTLSMGMASNGWVLCSCVSRQGPGQWVMLLTVELVQGSSVLVGETEGAPKGQLSMEMVSLN